MFCFYLKLLSETYLNLRRIQLDIINAPAPACIVPAILVRFERILNFLDRFSKNPQIGVPNFIKIRPVGADVLLVDGQTDRQTDKQTD